MMTPKINNLISLKGKSRLEARFCTGLFPFLHQTTTGRNKSRTQSSLSNIIFLHQTTTGINRRNHWWCCQISSFYIKPQRPGYPVLHASGCQISSFYIKPQHLRCGPSVLHRCQISSFYIKPQHRLPSATARACCQISSFYIKPQRWVWQID